jgi:small-conductance mechanosensitive channel
MFFMDWLWFELVRDKKTTSGQGREANLLLRIAEQFRVPTSAFPFPQREVRLLNNPGCTL